MAQDCADMAVDALEITPQINIPRPVLCLSSCGIENMDGGLDWHITHAGGCRSFAHYRAIVGEHTVSGRWQEGVFIPDKRSRQPYLQRCPLKDSHWDSSMYGQLDTGTILISILIPTQSP